MDVSANNKWWYYLAGARDVLYCIFMLFMPFTQVLTFNLGFPLKFSELALILLAFLYLATRRRVRLPRPVILIFSFLFFIVTVSVVVNYFWNYPYTLRPFETRFGYTGDSISRYVYFILALLSFFISVDIFTQNPRRYIRFWLYGALIAACYAWYLGIFSFLRLPVYLLPGHPQEGPQTISVFNRAIIRCGTFLEGNMMGLYLILSASLAFYIRKYRAGIFLLASVMTTFSTLGMVSVFLFLLIFLHRVIFQRKNLVYLPLAIALTALFIYFFSGTTLYKEYVYKKLVAKTEKIDDATAISKADRLFGIKDAYGMGIGNPVLGVGLANYSRHYDRYMDKKGFDPVFVQKLYRKNSRVIPNNIYLEIWAECGGIALLLFVVLLGMLLYYSRWDTTKAILPGIVCMILCFNAYPSFIMIYLWCFMALPVADHLRRSGYAPSVESSPIAPS
jgi:hypothetical protein